MAASTAIRGIDRPSLARAAKTIQHPIRGVGRLLEPLDDDGRGAMRTERIDPGADLLRSIRRSGSKIAVGVPQRRCEISRQRQRSPRRPGRMRATGFVDRSAPGAITL